MARARRTDPEVRAAAALAQRQRRKDPAIAAKDRATSKAWKHAHPERAAAASNAPDKRARDRARRQTPRGRMLGVLATARRRVRISAGDGVSAAEWVEILQAFNHRCGYCLADGPLEMEHMVALSRGGVHTASNVVPACARCNRRKGTKSLLEFLSIGDAA